MRSVSLEIDSSDFGVVIKTTSGTVSTCNVRACTMQVRQIHQEYRCVSTMDMAMPLYNFPELLADLEMEVAGSRPNS